MPVIGAVAGDALKAYKAVLQGGAGQASTASSSAASSGGSFLDMLKSVGNEAVNSIKGGEIATAQAATGKADTTSIVTAVSSAQMTLQTVVAVRDKVIDAYKSVIGMPI